MLDFHIDGYPFSDEFFVLENLWFFRVKCGIMARHTNEEALVLGDEVIIGQTILEKMDLLVDCRERRLLPNPAHPDQPVLKVK